MGGLGVTGPFSFRHRQQIINGRAIMFFVIKAHGHVIQLSYKNVFTVIEQAMRFDVASLRDTQPPDLQLPSTWLCGALEKVMKGVPHKSYHALTLHVLPRRSRTVLLSIAIVCCVMSAILAFSG